MKILKNKRGFSLVELMVVVAIMGILSAIAIPAYLTYQENARQGVAESILHLVDRTVAIELARGAGLPINFGDVWNRIQSNDKGKFTAPTFTEPTSNSNNEWCVNIEGTDDYIGVGGCVQNADNANKVLIMVGSNQDCASITGIADQSACPNGCTFNEGSDSATNADNTCGTDTYSAASTSCTLGKCSSS